MKELDVVNLPVTIVAVSDRYVTVQVSDDSGRIFHVIDVPVELLED